MFGIHKLHRSESVRAGHPERRQTVPCTQTRPLLAQTLDLLALHFLLALICHPMDSVRSLRLERSILARQVSDVGDQVTLIAPGCCQETHFLLQSLPSQSFVLVLTGYLYY